MAKTTEPDPPPKEETDPPAGDSTDQRIASLEAGQSGLEKKIDRILGIVAGGPDDPDPGDGGQPAAGNVADEIRTQLDARDAKAKTDREAASLVDELGQVKAKVAELAEKPPAPMPRRVEKLMGWR
jgi:hypothetical protein